MKKISFIVLLGLIANIASAQIGYQVSLLNSATGQPRAGETVTVGVKLTNSENATVYTTQQKATSNDFGVLSLSIGDAETFEELDWNKLPLYIEVSIDGVLIAKSQVLSVPVAEYAKKSGFVLTRDFLASRTWEWVDWSLMFNSNGNVVIDAEGDRFGGNYYIDGNSVFILLVEAEDYPCYIFSYIPDVDALVLVEETGVVFE